MKKKGIFRIIFGRTMFLVLFMLIQVLILLSAFVWMKDYIAYIFGGFTLLSAGVVIYIISSDAGSSFKLAWVVPVLIIPVFGSLFYLFVKLQFGTHIIGKKLRKLQEETKVLLKQDPEVLNELDKRSVNLAEYMNHHGKYPTYANTNVKYFPQGEDMFEAMKVEMEAATRFIFMEFFIVERGEMWNSLVEILKRKVKEGVEVRVMYDGMCCLSLLPYHYPKELEAYGIQCKMFSPIRPALSSYQNNRDHRKILVIDGHTAFTGGVNLADEYINKKLRFGHWKDTAIMLKGDAVKSFTMMFLQMWNITVRKGENYGKFLMAEEYSYPPKLFMEGFVMPYGDSPLDRENVGEQVYIDILYRARNYVHIMTPYLILDDELTVALTYAAKRGVDTVIMMPHIPDKKSAFLLAHSYYQELLHAGVKIYEYTPGFVHGKMFISDDEKAVVGTVNLDFRSLYLHFECGAYLYRVPEIREIEQDFQETLKKCEEITLQTCKNYPWYEKFIGKILHLFAPLM